MKKWGGCTWDQNGWCNIKYIPSTWSNGGGGAGEDLSQMAGTILQKETHRVPTSVIKNSAISHT